MFLCNYFEHKIEMDPPQTRKQQHKSAKEKGRREFSHKHVRHIEKLIEKRRMGNSLRLSAVSDFSSDSVFHCSARNTSVCLLITS